MRELVIKTAVVPVVVDITVLIPLFLFWALGYPLVFLVALFFSLLHEGAHLLVAMLFGYTPTRISVNMFGEVLHLKETQIWPEHQMLIHLAGPVLNLMVAFFCFILVSRDPYSFLYSFEGVFSGLELVLIVNLFLALFNLIPCFPLDGGKVVMVYLSFYFGNEAGRRFSLLFGKLFSIFNFILGLYLIQYNVLNGLICALAVNIYFACWKEDKRQLLQKVKKASIEQERSVKVFTR